MNYQLSDKIFTSILKHVYLVLVIFFLFSLDFRTFNITSWSFEGVMWFIILESVCIVHCIYNCVIANNRHLKLKSDNKCKCLNHSKQQLN